MDLKKWEFGTPMGEQIENQNDNLTEIDANVTSIEDALKQSLVLGKGSVGVNVVPPKGSKGLYVKDGLINGYTIANVLYLYASHNTYGAGNIPEAVKQNWSKVPEGVSLAHLKVGTEGVAIIHKYTGKGDIYGSFISFGLSPEGGRVRRFVLYDGKWEEKES